MYVQKYLEHTSRNSYCRKFFASFFWSFLHHFVSLFFVMHCLGWAVTFCCIIASSSSYHRSIIVSIASFCLLFILSSSCLLPSCCCCLCRCFCLLLVLVAYGVRYLRHAFATPSQYSGVAVSLTFVCVIIVSNLFNN